MAFKMNGLANSILVSLTVISLPLLAVTITGDIISSLPTVNVTKTNGEAIAFVKSLTLEFDGGTGPCDFTFSEEDALSSLEPKCFVEWNQEVELDVYTHSGKELKGIPGGAEAEAEFGYTISIFNRSGPNSLTTSKVLINSGNITFDILEPLEPKLINTVSKISTVSYNGPSVENFDITNRLDSLEVEVEKRNYDQKVIFSDYGNCLVLEGQNKCSVLTYSHAFGSENEKVGDHSVYFNLNSGNDHFKLDFPKKVKYKWDYRPPVLEGLKAYVKSGAGSESKVASISGITLDLENETAIAVISSPHHNRTDAWWLPKTVELTFNPNHNTLPNSEIIIEGNVLFEAPVPGETKKITLESLGEPVRNGDQWIYKFDLKSVDDGIYTMELAATDDNQNSNIKDFGDIDLIRTTPQIKLFRNYNELGDKEGFYFTENLLVASFNDYLGSSKIDGVTLNGESLALDNDRKDVKRIIVDADTLGLEPGSEYEFNVLVSDSAGNQTSKKYTATYRPIAFDLKVNTGPQAYQSVQNVIVKLYEIENNICSFYPTAEIAKKTASKNDYSCVFRWTEIPDGLTQNTREREPVINGALQNEGVNKIFYEISLYDHEGHESLVTSRFKNITVIPPTIPEILLPEVDIDTGMYISPMTGGYLLAGRVNSIAADINVNTGVIGSNSESNYKRRQSNRSQVQSTSVKVKVDSGELWEVRDVPIYAEYEKIKEVNATKSIKALFVPANGVTVRMKFESEFALDNQNEKVIVSLGRLDRKTRLFDYDAKTMGEWDVRLVKKINRTSLVDISEVQRVSSQDDIVFDLAPGVIKELSSRIMAVATIVSPEGKYKKEINSNKMYMRILNGGNVEGTHRYKNKSEDNKVVGKVPFTVTVQYKPKTKKDHLSIDQSKVYWEESADGVTWTLLTQFVKNRKTKEYENKPITSLRYRERKRIASNSYIRTVLTNKYTGEVNYSENLNIIAYDKVSLKINRTNTAFNNEDAEYKLFVKVPEPENKRKYTLEEASPAEMEIQWSYDEIDWFDDNDNLLSVNESDLINDEGEVTKSRYLMARTRLLGGAVSVGDDGWSAPAKISYQWIKPVQVKIRNLMPKQVEEGTDFIASAEVVVKNDDISDRIRYEWLLDNEVVGTDVTELELIADPLYIDRNYYRIKLNAWIDGLKVETLKETKFKVKTWKYKFPITRIKVLNSSVYAPNDFKVQANVRLPRIEGIEFISEFFIADAEGDNEASFTTGRNKLATFSFKKPGMKRVGYRLSDNRGNTSEVTEIVELFPPLPMNLELTSSYSNPDLIYPLDVAFRVSTEVDHPEDRVNQWEWYVTNLSDNTVEEYSMRGRLYLRDLGAKEMEVDYQVRLVATTIFGQVGESTFDIHVNKNKPPTCAMSMAESSTQLTWEMKCSDVDSDIAKYNWFINGVKLSNYKRTITMTKSRIEGSSVTVKGEGVDDAGNVDSVTQVYLVK
jgi:hypothetical protein